MVAREKIEAAKYGLEVSDKPTTKKTGQDYRELRDNLLLDWIERNKETVLYCLEAQIAGGWIKINSLDDLPKKPGLRSYEHVHCLINLEGGICEAMWNCEHGVWDDRHGDDFMARPLEPSHYMIITAPEGVKP